ncbi:hypothetical protein [Kutzneria kofuensis]|uniref:Transcriptional regulator, AbiEi antitoxin, Type IV TA system n=1 Tax=Kutzneria kofuensis TaxID=103725 RepID=A0A7W9KDZ0_9PSEU|nr:hypothetical protein [Kutzneria kofuensis]MBB5890695.1 hypothetical protein [Kutzneria kofuensis]
MRTCSPSGTHIQLDKLNGLFPHRVARAEDLVELGLCASSVYRRCRPGGPWQRVLPGVLVLGNSPPTPPQLVQAALRYAEPDGVLTGHHALLLHGMRSAPPLPYNAVHVLVPKGRSLKGTPEVLVERTTRMPKAVMRKGFLVAPLERALLDTVRGFGHVEQVRPLLTEAVWLRGLAPKLINAELDAGNGRGSALPRRVLAEVVNGIRTEAEALAATLVGTARLPKPKWNMQVDDAENAYLGPVSAWWDDVALALDIDVAEQSFERTVDRHGALTAAGIVVVHTTPQRLRDAPKVFVEQLRRAHQWAAKRERPPVTATAQHPRSCGAR